MKMADVGFAPVSLKCKVCGGDIVNNYLSGTCSCANCGNKWSIEDVIPNYSKYSRIITSINKAHSLLEGNPKFATINEAKLLFKTTTVECNGMNDAVSAELAKLCHEGQAKAEKLAAYTKGKELIEKKSYKSAMNELKKNPGYRDTEQLIAQCEAGIKEEQKKQIPWAVVFSLIIPATLGIYLYEKFGMPLGGVIPICLVCSAGLGFLVYRGGGLAIAIKIVSVLLAVPLTIFAILAYACHLSTGLSVAIAIGAPIAILIIAGIYDKLTSSGERKKGNG